MPLYLIENSSMMYRFFFGYPDMRRPSDDHPINVAHGCCTAFWRLVRQHPSHVAVVMDKGRSEARTALSPTYKAQRPPMKPDLARQIPFSKRAAQAFGFAIVERQGVEADDLIATHTRLALEAGHEVVIVSTDKDMMQLIGPSVVMFDPLKNRPVTADDVVTKFGCPPEKLGDLLAMTGDAADNIEGMKGVGPKKAAALLERFGDLEAVIEAADQIMQPQLREAVKRDAWKARLARKLVTLDMHVDVSETVSDFAYSGFDTRSVLDFLDEMELVTLRAEIATGMMEAA